jgi:phospholipid/cholesterol/gamma-HCH transport system substrate-binding protein
VNYALVGGFVLVLSGLLIAILLWIASGGAFRKQYDLYLAVEHESVAGLNPNAPVKYNGVDVGKVRSIKLDPAEPERVQLTFAIEQGTPVRQDTLAVLKIQGLTGIAYVELSGGTAGAALLKPTSQEPYPEIRTRPSLSTRLETVLTSVLAKLDRTSGNIDAVLSTENRAALSSALADIAAVAHTIAARRGTLDAGITSAARTFDNAARDSAQLGPAIERVGAAAAAVEKMGNAATVASGKAADSVDLTATDARRFMADTLPELQRLLGELAVTAASLRRLTEQTERNPAALLFGRSPLPAGPGEAPVRQRPQ